VLPRSFSRQYSAIAFIAVFSAVGLALFLWSMATVPAVGWYVTLCVAFLAIASEFTPAIDARSPDMTLTDALVIFTLLVVGVSGAVWVACVDVLALACIGRLRSFMAGVNVGQLALTVFLVGELWVHTAGLPIPLRLVALLLVYYCVNVVLFVLGLRLIRGVPVKASVRNVVGLFTVGFLSILLLGELSALLYRSYGPAPLVLMLAFYILVSYMVERRAKDAATINQQAQDAIAAYHGMIHALARVIDARDEYTFGHSLRVATLSKRLAIATGSPYDPNRVYFAGLLHDIGKIGLPDLILLKPDVLNRGETDKMMEHPAIGAQILADAHLGDEILGAVRHHHEWQNGNGYPDALHASQIPPLASIVGVADAFDAMASNRPYRSGLPLDKVRAILAETAGQQYDERLVATLFEILDNMSLQEFQDMGYGSEPPNKEAKPLAEIEGGTMSLVERFQKHQELIEREVKQPRGRAELASDGPPLPNRGGRVADLLGSFVEGTVRGPSTSQGADASLERLDKPGADSFAAVDGRGATLPATLAERASLGEELDERLREQGATSETLESAAETLQEPTSVSLPELLPESDRARTAEPVDPGARGEVIAAQDSDAGGAQAPASPVHDATAETDARSDGDDPGPSEPKREAPSTASRSPQEREAQAADVPSATDAVANAVAGQATDAVADPVDASPDLHSSDAVPPPASDRQRRRRPHGHECPCDPTQPPTPITPGSQSGR
jgi:putative nucleotidyltransferase with HDIG domain